MINEVLKGITDALYAAFGDDYEIHTEASMQDMEEPAFLCAASTVSYTHLTLPTNSLV